MFQSHYHWLRVTYCSSYELCNERGWTKGLIRRLLDPADHITGYGGYYLRTRVEQQEATDEYQLALQDAKLRLELKRQQREKMVREEFAHLHLSEKEIAEIILF